MGYVRYYLKTCVVIPSLHLGKPLKTNNNPYWFFGCATIRIVIKALNNVAYIDNTNLHKGTEAEGFLIDYKKFRTYLKEKLGVKTAYIFIGYVPGNEERYRKFQELGYTLIFKPTLPDSNGKIKGNCDAELVLQAVRDYYEKSFSKMIVVSSDGDFGCLIQFLQERGSLEIVLSPRSKNKCSTLIKRLSPRVTFLPEVKHLISR